VKKFIKTKAKLPPEEYIIGGDAPRSSINKERKKIAKELIREIKDEIFKSSEKEIGKRE
jgi:hypothetical protein